MVTHIEDALDYSVKFDDRFVSELIEFIKIPSISILPEFKPDVARAAEWLAARLLNAGMQRVEIFPTALHPIVYGENLAAGDEACTVLIYGHYDVQQAEPLEDWNTEPFDPTIIDGNLYGRGTTDNKGEVMMTVAALESLAKTGGIPVNIKVLFEGEEEVITDNLSSFLDEHLDLLQSDICLNVDGGMHEEGIPAIEYGLRGILHFNLKVRGPKHDLHSGLYGGIVQNPILVLCELIAKIQREDGRIDIPGFYDKVRPISEKEQEFLSKDHHNEEYFEKLAGVPVLWGELGYSPVERIGARPCCDILRIEGGARKTAIPANANANISFRIVPDQQPEEIERLFRDFVARNMPPTVQWELEYLYGCQGSLLNLDSPYLSVMGEAIESVWDSQPIFNRGGGTIPVVSQIEEKLGLSTVLIGISLPDDNMHGPNEKINLETWRNGIQTLIHYFSRLGIK